jgi:hypothetical protein
LIKIVVSLRSTVGFVSNLNKFQFRKCRRFSQNFSFIGFAARELHLPEVEGVKIVCFFSNLVKIVLVLGITLDLKTKTL